MTYTIYDSSIRQGAPVEGYEFTGVFGTMRYSDQPQDIYIAGKLFRPAVMLRDANIVTGSLAREARTMSLSVPQDAKLARSYGSEMTPDRLMVTVYRAHHGDNWETEYRVIWSGIARGYAYRSRVFSAIMGAEPELLAHRRLRKVKLTVKCNHVLYDKRCKANRAANVYQGRVELVSPDGNQVTYADTPPQPNGYFAPGSVINKATGEVRVVVVDEAGVVTIDRPFSEISVGDALEVVRGCDKTYAHCLGRFNNVRNYGGFRDQPNDSVLITKGVGVLPPEQLELVTGKFERLKDPGVF